MNIKPNALFTGDNLYVLNGMNSECIDLIYLDPPFNSKRMYKAPVGSKAAGAEFKDMWTWQDVDVETLERMVIDYPGLVDYIQTIGAVHSKAMMSYITYMAQRLIQCHRVLKITGSIYLHCDPTASHFLKLILDCIFGRQNFRNEIVWHYGRWTAKANRLQRQHDCILFYAKSKQTVFNQIYTNHTEQSLKEYRFLEKPDGNIQKIKGLHDYQQLHRMNGRVFRTLRRKDTKGTDKDRSYLDQVEGVRQSDVFVGIPYLSGSSRERTGYPTQKPLALLEIIIKGSSNEGEVVLDPFCGCATAMVSAQQHRRKWIGIDISGSAADVLMERLSDDAGVLKDFAPKERLDFIHRTDIPARTDIITINLKNAAEKDEIRDRLYGGQGGDCAGCHRHFQKQDFHIDHIIPKNKGGGDYAGNLQLLCGNCNSVKGDRPMEYLRARIHARREKLQKVSFGY